MITIPKKVEYSAILISYLAHEGTRTVPLKEISQKMLLPYRFMGQLANQLKQAGILESKEGMGGGYRLREDWQKKNVYDLIEALKENKHLVKCLGGVACKRLDKCRMQKLWMRLENDFVDQLKAISLSEV